MRTSFILLFGFIILHLKGLGQYRLKLIHSGFRQKAIYVLTIPEKFKLKSGKDYHGPKEVHALLKDSSVIYLTDDLKTGSSHEIDKIDKYGYAYSLNHYLFNDTATLSGVRNGKYWKEHKYYSVIVGYYNVDFFKKQFYDTIINEIIPQVDRNLLKNSLGTQK